MFPKCSIPENANWQVKHKPVTSFVNRLIERGNYNRWYHVTDWEKRAVWSYAEQLAARWKRLHNCHCQDN